MWRGSTTFHLISTSLPSDREILSGRRTDCWSWTGRSIMAPIPAHGPRAQRSACGRRMMGGRSWWRPDCRRAVSSRRLGLPGSCDDEQFQKELPLSFLGPLPFRGPFSLLHNLRDTTYPTGPPPGRSDGLRSTGLDGAHIARFPLDHTPFSCTRNRALPQARKPPASRTAASTRQSPGRKRPS
jgi:hypothetical protein